VSHEPRAGSEHTDDSVTRTSADWPTLLRRIDSARSEWEAAYAAVDHAELTPGVRDDDAWGAWHVMNHTAAYLDAASDVLDALARGDSVDYSPAQKWMGDGVGVEEIEAALERSWNRYVAAVEQTSEARAPSALVTHVSAGTMDARSWVAMGASHIREHIAQLRDAT
jgi:hypothetical protein